MTFLSAIVLLGILIFVHEFGHFILAKLVGVRVVKFSLGFGPKLIGRKYGDTEYLISAVPLGGYVKPLGEEPDEEIKEEDKPFAYNYQPVWKRAAIVFAGPVFNFVLTYIIFVSFLAFGSPVGIPKLETMTSHIDEVVKDSPAEKAGLKSGDKIISVIGKDVYSWDEMTEVFRSSPNKELSIKVERDGQQLDIKVTPGAEKVKDIQGKEVTIGRIGVVKKKMPFDIIVSDSVWDAPIKGLEATYKASYLILEVVKKLVTGSLSIKTMGGPIAIVSESGKVAAMGILPYLMFLSLMSVNLGVLNLLPIPILDGGHLMFLTIEAIRRKPLSEKVMMNAQKIGLAVIITLMVFVIYNDTVRIVIPWIMRMI